MIPTGEKKKLQNFTKVLYKRVVAQNINVSLNDVRWLVVQGYQYKFKPRHWRFLGTIVIRNPSVFLLEPKTVAFRILYHPDMLELK